LEVISTPGHSAESACFLLLESKAQRCLFSGDTLLLGDAGRVDFCLKKKKDELVQRASDLFDSVRKLAALSKECILYPGHGFGSSVARKIAEGDSDSLENQLKVSQALKIENKSDFVKAYAIESPSPAFYQKCADANKGPLTPLAGVLKAALLPLNAEQFAQHVAKGSLILDARSASQFAERYIPGSLLLPLTLNFIF